MWGGQDSSIAGGRLGARMPAIYRSALVATRYEDRSLRGELKRGDRFLVGA